MAPQKRTRDEGAGGSSAASHAKKARKGFKVGPQNLPDGPWKRKIDKKKAQLIEKAKVKKAYSKVRERELGSALARKPRRTHEASASKPEDEEAKEDQEEPIDAASEDDSSDDEDGGIKVDWEDESAEPTEPVADKPAQSSTPATSQPVATEEDEIHPDRQAMLDNGGEPENPNEIAVRQRQPKTGAADAAAAAPSADDKTTTGGDRFDADLARRSRSRNKPDYFAKQLAQAEKRKAEAEERTRDIERRRAEREAKIAEREVYRKRVAKARREDKNGRRKLGRESGLLLDKIKRMVGQ